MPTEQRLERMRTILQYRQPDLTVVCENIHDPHNVSAILRSCDAVGIDTVRLFYSYQEFPILGKKSSGSATKWINIENFSDAAELRDSLKVKGFTIYATHLQTPNPLSIYEVDWTKPSAIIMGNEHFGVSEDVLAIADHNVYIPMMGMIKSLNVSVATAVTLYEACRQRIDSGLYPRTDADPEYLAAEFQKWQEK